MDIRPFFQAICKYGNLLTTEEVVEIV